MAFNLGRWIRDRKKDIVDVFDANTEEDQRKRLARGQPRYYQQQQAQRAQRQRQRPAPSRFFGRDDTPGFQLFNNSLTRGVSGAVRDVRNTLDMTGKGLANVVGASRSEQDQIARGQNLSQNAFRQYTQDLRSGKINQARYNQLIRSLNRGDEGLLRQNKNIQKYSNPRRVLAATADTAFTIGTAGVGGAGFQAGRQLAKQVAQQGVRRGVTGSAGRQAIRQVGRDMRTGTALGAFAGGAGALRQEQAPTARQLVQSTAMGAGIGAMTPVAGAAVGAISPSVARGTQRAAQASARAVRNIDETPQTLALRDTNMRLQRQFDRTTNQRQRRIINQQIARNNEEIRRIKQGGYAKNPFAGNDEGMTPQVPSRAIPGLQNHALVQPVRPGVLVPGNVTSPSIGRTSTISIPANSQVAPQKQLQEHYQQSSAKSRLPETLSVVPSSLSRLISLPQTQLATKNNTLAQMQPIRNSLTNDITPSAEQQVFRHNPMSPEFKAESPIEPRNTTSDVPKQEVNVSKRGGHKQIPVSKVTQDGRLVTKTDVKTGKEQRFTVDDKGELLPDRKGAYRLFSDSDGKITQLRIGDEVFDAKDLGDLSDVNGYGSTLATMRRNVERAFGAKTAQKVNRFLVDHQQSQATKLIDRRIQLKKGMQQIADDLGISFGIGRRNAKKVSAAIQEFGEGVKTKQQLIDEFGSDTASRIIMADQWFRAQYDTLLNEMNDTLTRYGYDPVPKRENYYTHFQDPSVWKSFGLKMHEIKSLGNPSMQDALPEAPRGKISNKLAGESEYMQPNKRFNPFAQKREGNTYTPDAFQAFERYLNPTLNNIYMTPSITRARVLSKAIAQEADIDGKDINKTVIQIKEWANNLAGKSNRFDRPLVDSNWGDKYIKASQFLQRRVGQNAIVGNLATAALQPIVLAQSTGKFGTKNILLSIAQELSTAHGKNAPIRQSAFMRRRYANLNPITATKTERARNIANTPLQVVEETSARITWNAAHNDALSKGLSGKDAIRYADIETEKTLAGRSLGERPELFMSKASSPFTMFQLEVNNFWQQFSKEMTKAQAARTLIAVLAFNMVLEQVSGRNVGFNPIDAVIDSYNEATGDESLGDKTKAIGQRFAGEFVDNAPIVAPLLNAGIGDKNLRALLGETSNAGRFGVSSPIGSLVNNPWYLASPFGGAQAKKTLDAAKTLQENSLTSKDGDVQTSVDGSNPLNQARGLLFGKGAIPEVKDYYENDNTSTGDSTLDAAVNDIKLTKKEYKKALNRVSEKHRTLEALTDDEEQDFIDRGIATEKDFVNAKKAVNKVKEKYGINKSEGSKNFKDEPDAKKLIDSISDYSDDEKDKWRQTNVGPTGKRLIDRASAIRPDGFPELPQTHAVAEAYAELLKKREKGLTKLEDNDAKIEFLKKAYKSQYPKDTTDIGDLSTDETASALDNGLITQDQLSKAVELDDFLLTYGLSTTAMISKKTREAYGYGAPPTRKGGGGSGGGRGKKLSPSDFALPTDILTKYSSKGAELARNAKLTKTQSYFN